MDAQQRVPTSLLYEDFRESLITDFDAHALHLSSHRGVHFRDAHPHAVDHGQRGFQSVFDAVSDGFDELGADGHFVIDDFTHEHIVCRLGEVVAGCGTTEVEFKSDIHDIIAADDGFFLPTAVVGVHAHVVDGDARHLTCWL